MEKLDKNIIELSNIR